MNQSESTNQLNQLLRQDASCVKAWLKDIWSGKLKAPEEFNWLGLAQGATSIANSGDANVSNLSWAEVATSVYDKLIAEESIDGKEAHMFSLMMLQAAMIAKFGFISGHPVLDIDRVILWFFDSLTISRQEAETKAASWMQYSMDEIRELRGIKNRLRVILALADSGKLIPDEELSQWLLLRKKLP